MFSYGMYIVRQQGEFSDSEVRRLVVSIDHYLSLLF